MNNIDVFFKDSLEPKITKNFLTAEDQAFLIKYINALHGRDEMRDGNGDNKRVYNPEYLDLRPIVKKYSQKVFDEYPTSEPIYVHVMGLIKYVEGDSMEVHWDLMDENCRECVLSAVMYLNDNYEGGEIIFPKLLKEYHPEAGSMVSYPSLDTRFDHGVNVVTYGVRYALAWCFTTDLKKAFKPYLLSDRI